MKKSILSLLLVLVLSLTLAAAAGAESTADLILGIGTAQSFSSDPVPDEDIRVILQAGASSVSAINQQPWFFVALTNRDLMAEIAGSGMSFGGKPDTLPDNVEMLPEAPEAASEDGSSGTFSEKPVSFSGAKASLGDSPLAVIIYENEASKSPAPQFDCGLAAQNMRIAAASLGYGVKIVSSPTMTLNGEMHDEICEKLGVDPSLKAVAVLLIGKTETDADAVSSASVRDALEIRSVVVH